MNVRRNTKFLGERWKKIMRKLERIAFHVRIRESKQWLKEESGKERKNKTNSHYQVY